MSLCINVILYTVYPTLEGSSLYDVYELLLLHFYHHFITFASVKCTEKDIFMKLFILWYCYF